MCGTVTRAIAHNAPAVLLCAWPLRCLNEGFTHPLLKPFTRLPSPHNLCPYAHTLPPPPPLGGTLPMHPFPILHAAAVIRPSRDPSTSLPLSRTHLCEKPLRSTNEARSSGVRGVQENLEQTVHKMTPHTEWVCSVHCKHIGCLLQPARYYYTAVTSVSGASAAVELIYCLSVLFYPAHG